VHDAELLDDPPPVTRQFKTRLQPRLVLLVALVTALISMAVCTAAILVPAPAPAVPFVVAVCVGAPLFAGWEAPGALAWLRAVRWQRKALAGLLRTLEQLPEVRATSSTADRRRGSFLTLSG
jgi:hypothetical protein